MKLSNLILLSIASIGFFYIQLWEQQLVTPIYLSLLGVGAVYGLYVKDINMTHITGFILVITLINRAIFETSLINYMTPEEDPVLQGLFIYGTQFLFSFIVALVLIFRVQLSRLLSKSKSIALTHFDGIFHWLYIYTSVIYLLALLENIAWSYFNMKSWTLIYDNFEGLIYVAWALSCGAIITMMITSTKSNHHDEKEEAIS
ncbi:hypothetical protein [Pseudoalteromonas aurantia]|uniref:Intracellular septation protein A n=1 Tax=Pseudoalteromonas aurantia 208 TaxID=1314867 RepID=A0ABR9E650_9GAMM|nr:hypothetical protein [Pseudoalteromonas aurantia]MBE0366463.1 hypothetical protein [Pseudoalteromonas aurantia 208]